MGKISLSHLATVPSWVPTLVTLILPPPFKKSVKKDELATLPHHPQGLWLQRDPRGTNPKSSRSLACPCSSPGAGEEAAVRLHRLQVQAGSCFIPSALRPN